MADNSYGIWIISFLLVGILGMAFLTTINDAISTTTTPTATTGETLANYGENTVSNTPLHAVTSVYTALTSTALTGYTIVANVINLNTDQASTLELVAPHAEAAGYWSFNVNNSTNTIDDANGLNNGTVTNASWIDTDCPYGGCYEFNGVDEYITITTSDSLNNSETFSVSLWVKPLVVGLGILYDKRVDSTSGIGYALYINNLKVGFRIQNGTSGNAVETITALPAGEYAHIVGIREGSDYMIYKNGILQNTATLTGDIMNSVNPRVGAASVDAASKFNGTIDEPRIYNRSLSVEEIKEQYDTYMNTSVYKADYTYEQSGYVEGTSSNLLWLIPTFLLLSLLVLFWRLADQGA